MSELFVIVVFCVVSCYVGVCNLARTRESLRFLFFLYATIRASGQRMLSVGSCSIMCQCLCNICPMYLVLLYGTENMGLFLVVDCFPWLSSSICVYCLAC